MKFRNGQWVLFNCDRELADAHRAADGRYVGIYQHAGEDIHGKPHPEAVIPVQSDGCNIRVPNAKTLSFDLVQLPPAQVRDLAPLLETSDMPPGRLQTVAEGWTPRAAQRAAFLKRLRSARRLASAGGDVAEKLVAVLRSELGVLDRLLSEGKIDQATYDATMSALEDRADEAID